MRARALRDLRFVEGSNECMSRQRDNPRQCPVPSYERGTPSERGTPLFLMSEAPLWSWVSYERGNPLVWGFL